MDIFNRPPAIAEDTLQYTIHPPNGSSDKPSATALATHIRAFVDSLLPGFIWHRDPFELKLEQDPDDEGWMLSGRIRVGDCVDDEWFTVWFLREISRTWDVVISTYDSDGEFLLIEAAAALPDWVKPTNSENRVWIHGSRLHLIPISHVSPPSRNRHRRKLPGARESDDEGENARASMLGKDEEDWLAANDAVKLVRNPLIETYAPSAVEALVWQRINGYPEAAKNHTHRTKAYIPIDIARALSAQPSLAQRAAETFYTRDAIQLRAAHKMLRFAPDTSVLSSVKMTRTAYAQLQGQKFFAPKIFGRWQEMEGTQEWRWRDTGMKIAVGFEMLFQESKNRKTVSASNLAQSSEATKEALGRNPEYNTYIQTLVSTGYFGDEIQGSERWKERESKASHAFLEARRTENDRDSFATQVNSAIANSIYRPDEPLPEEDDDEWLHIDSQALDALLENAAKPGRPISPNAMNVDGNENGTSIEDRVTNEQAERLQKLASQVNQFVEGEGDLEGALFADEPLSDFSDEPMSDSESNEESEAVRQADRQAAMDKLVPGLEPSEYGKMPPSFHSHSQRVTSATAATDIVDEQSTKESSGAGSTFHGRRIRQPILPRDHFDGVDSDDESEEEEDSESEEDKPQVVGEIEIDMNEEQEEFLEFSRQALGISDLQWQEIIKDRKERGAFVPPNSGKKVDMQGLKLPEVPRPTRVERPSGEPNPALNSFDAVMKALDEELSKSKAAAKGKGKSKATQSMPEDETSSPMLEDEQDIISAMENELKAALVNEGTDDDDEDGGEEPDLNLIKNFLESFKSQAGLSGPVGNLVGRLQPGWTLPRDES